MSTMIKFARSNEKIALDVRILLCRRYISTSKELTGAVTRVMIELLVAIVQVLIIDIALLIEISLNTAKYRSAKPMTYVSSINVFLRSIQMTSL